MNARRALVVSLLALAATYVGWFAGDRQAALAWMVFALPPALLALGVARGWRGAGFWAGVCALGWFSHGVMLAWSEPAGRGWALAVVALAVAVVLAANLPGLRARFGRPDGPGRNPAP
jgi:uncharacterized membrane protein